MIAAPLIPVGPLSASMRAEVERYIAAEIPEGKRGAIVGVASTDGGVTIAAAAKLGDDWKLAGDVGRRWDGVVSGRVYVIGSW